MGRFQQVCHALSERYTLVQIGSATDPKLDGALDYRGRTSLRESAAILASSKIFIGLEGLLMHLARAVDCPSVSLSMAVDRGPSQIGYICNVNLTGGEPPCVSPCWQRNRCDYNHECMRMIQAERVIDAAQELGLRQARTPLSTQTAII